MGKELSKYEAAKQAVSECRSVDEVKNIRDKAMAMRIYAQQAQDTTMETHALEIRLRAERKLGQMMKEQPKASGGEHYHDKPTGVRETPVPRPITLTEAGIDKNLAKKARTLAKLSDEEFEERIESAKSLRRYTEQTTRKEDQDLSWVIETLTAIKFTLLKHQQPCPEQIVNQAIAQLDGIKARLNQLKTTKETVVCLTKRA